MSLTLFETGAGVVVFADDVQDTSSADQRAKCSESRPNPRLFFLGRGATWRRNTLPSHLILVSASEARLRDVSRGALLCIQLFGI